MIQIWIVSLKQLCELGNFGTHIALRNLRPPGTRVRKIPVPDWNPLTKLFKYVFHEMIFFQIKIK